MAGHPRMALALTTAAALLGVAGCGGATRIPSGHVLNVSLGEYRLRPADVQVSSGLVTIVVRNLGRLTHDLVVADGPRWVGSTRPLWPGHSQTLTLVLPAGSYAMYSSLLSDQALGAYGTLRVTR